MFDGTANPTPTFPRPAPPVSICELTPMTRASPSRSGPPESPGLTAAGVWIAPGMAKPSGASIWRPRADTTPAVSVRSRPNGLPRATARAPTRERAESADRAREVADADARGVGERERAQPATDAPRQHAHEGEVRRPVAPDDTAGGRRRVVAALDAEWPAVTDHVRVARH